LKKINEVDYDSDPVAGLQDVMAELDVAMRGTGTMENLKFLVETGNNYLAKIKDTLDKAASMIQK
jgi:hypothetical protein